VSCLRRRGERAVRAASAVRNAVASLNQEQPGRDLHVRIAVNTGEALADRVEEAEAQLELARAFYRKVGASAFLAEADAIVAAAS
jgi:class 3 adenylate cyclase